MHPIKSSSDKREKKLEKLKKFALECRKVRLYVADHPGLTSYEINRGVGFSSGWHLAKMSGMGIMTFSAARTEDGRRPQRWYVVPQ